MKRNKGKLNKLQEFPEFRGVHETEMFHVTLREK